jgi:hypothetical protein
MSPSPELSNAYVDFLKKFDGPPMSQMDIECYCGNQGWEEALGTSVAEVVTIFKEQNLIRLAKPSADAEYLADYLISVDELKRLLKQEGLKVSGKKKDLINRLLEHKPSLLVAALPDKPLFMTTDSGSALVSNRVRARYSRREQCELTILDLIYEGKINDAIEAWNQYAQGETYASSVESERLDREIRILNTIRHEVCTYLTSRLSLEAIDALRTYASIRHVCGKSLTQPALEKLGPDLERFSKLSNGQPADISARMLTFYAIGQEKLRSFKRMGFHLVSVSACSESCQHCQDQSKVQCPIEQAPELPHSLCTHAMGCRCTYGPHAES